MRATAVRPVCLLSALLSSRTSWFSGSVDHTPLPPSFVAFSFFLPLVVVTSGSARVVQSSCLVHEFMDQWREAFDRAENANTGLTSDLVNATLSERRTIWHNNHPASSSTRVLPSEKARGLGLSRSDNSANGSMRLVWRGCRSIEHRVLWDCQPSTVCYPSPLQ